MNCFLQVDERISIMASLIFFALRSARGVEESVWEEDIVLELSSQILSKKLTEDRRKRSWWFRGCKKHLAFSHLFLPYKQNGFRVLYNRNRKELCIQVTTHQLFTLAYFSIILWDTKDFVHYPVHSGVVMFCLYGNAETTEQMLSYLVVKMETSLLMRWVMRYVLSWNPLLICPDYIMD